MAEPLRRPRFQVHLSTAIVLMFVAGVFLWANILEMMPNGVPPVIGPHQQFMFSGDHNAWKEIDKPCYSIMRGFPFPITCVLYGRCGQLSSEQPRQAIWMPIADFLFAGNSRCRFVCERWIRWRASLKAER